MPGVVVTTATRSGLSAPLRSPSSQVFMAGLVERGDTTAAVLLRNMSDVQTLLGLRPSYGSLYDQLKVFFDEGGLQAYVGRVVGPAATKGTLSLVDKASVTPIATLRVDAQNPGVWSSLLTCEIQAGAITNSFRIILRLNGDVVQDVNNITSPADAQNKFAQSPYVRITNLGSATAVPNNNPAVLAPTALSAGADDRASVTTTHYLNALNLFSPGLGDGAVAIPGQTGTTIWTGIDAHCRANNRIGLLADIQTQTKANLISGAAGLNTEFCGMFAPWIVVSDGGVGTRTISPEGFVAACRARANEQIGPWRAPAGAIGKANTLLGVDVDYTTTDANDLDTAKVSVIRNIVASIRLYGWRSLSNDTTNYQYLKDRDLLNRLVVESSSRLEDYVYATIDVKGQLLSAMNAELVGMMDPIKQAGGVYPLVDNAGNELDPGYEVQTGSDVNTTQSLANNEVRARLLVRVAPTGGLVSLTIVKVGILSGF